jgi:aspartate 1-decarboxylase
MRTMLKSKIHQAYVTHANIYYEGSISIDKKLMEAADILPFEQVHVLNINNGARFETYAIEAEAGSGEIGIQGAAARLAGAGDRVIILTYRQVEEAEVHRHYPTRVYVNEQNVITEVKSAAGTLPLWEK